MVGGQEGVKILDSDDLLARFQKVRTDAWEWLKYVQTLDQVDVEQPIKPFPRDRKYLKLFTRIWEKETRLVVPKSRRMTMSWTCVALYTWEAAFHQGRSVAFVSKKEEDADELVRRSKFILENLTSEFPGVLPAWDYKYGKLNFPEIQSYIQGFPQGADQLRQFTFSGILADEMAFWEKAEDMYSATIPTLEGAGKKRGGRFVAISSPGPGFFKRLVHDQLDAGDERDAAAIELDREVHFPMDGVEVRRNPRNRFVVFQLHYTADPDKRSKEFKERTRSEMPLAKFEQEYELRWLSYAGLPVHTDWATKNHGSREPIEAEAGLPLLRGWDWGLTPACVVAQLVGDRLNVLREYTALNMGAKRFVNMVMGKLALEYPAWWRPGDDWIDFIDPAGVAKAQSDETQCVQYLRERRLRIVPSAVGWEERKQSVDYFLHRQTKAGSCFQLAIGQCPVLFRGFEGGYRYPEKMAEIEPAKIRPLKDEHSHPMDALQAITSRIRQMSRAPQIPMPESNLYAFGT